MNIWILSVVIFSLSTLPLIAMDSDTEDGWIVLPESDDEEQTISVPVSYNNAAFIELQEQVKTQQHVQDMLLDQFVQDSNVPYIRLLYKNNAISHDVYKEKSAQAQEQFAKHHKEYAVEQAISQENVSFIQQFMPQSDMFFKIYAFYLATKDNKKKVARCIAPFCKFDTETMKYLYKICKKATKKQCLKPLKIMLSSDLQLQEHQWQALIHFCKQHTKEHNFTQASNFLLQYTVPSFSAMTKSICFSPPESKSSSFHKRSRSL